MTDLTLLLVIVWQGLLTATVALIVLDLRDRRLDGRGATVGETHDEDPR